MVLIFWLLPAVAIFIRIYKNQRAATDPFHLYLGQTLIAWLISLLVHGLTDYTLAMYVPMTLFMMVLGLWVASENGAETAPNSKDIMVSREPGWNFMKGLKN